MKNLKKLITLLFVIGLLGISQGFACKLQPDELAGLKARETVSKTTVDVPLLVSDSEQRTFTRRDLSGRYSSFAQATLFDAMSNRTLYFTCIGVVTFDGRGHFTDREVHSYDGTIIRDQFTGTYAVNSDGSGTMHFVGANETYNEDIVLSNDGKDVTFLITEAIPGFVSQGTLKKQ